MYEFGALGLMPQKATYLRADPYPPVVDPSYPCLPLRGINPLSFSKQKKDLQSGPIRFRKSPLHKHKFQEALPAVPTSTQSLTKSLWRLIISILSPLKPITDRLGPREYLYFADSAIHAPQSEANTPANPPTHASRPDPAIPTKNLCK